MLTGTLDTFSVGEIVALLAASRVTGTLRVWTEDDEGTVHCKDGAVTLATVGAVPEKGVGDLLVRGGFVPEDAHTVVASTDELNETLGRVGADAERVHRYLATHTEESVFELDGWTDGELRLDADSEIALDDFFVYPAHELLASVDSRRDEWVKLLATVGSVDRLVHQADIRAEEDSEMSVSRAQLVLVSHIDGRRTIRQLARHLGTGLFQTCKLVAALLEGGLVVLGDELAGPAGGGTGDSEPRIAAPKPVSAPTPDQPDPSVGPTEFVEPGDGPARDLIVRLLSAVKEEL